MGNSRREREGEEMEKLDVREEQVCQPKFRQSGQSRMDKEVACEPGKTSRE